MPITSTSTFYGYNTDGFTEHFTFPYYVDNSDDILVQTIDLSDGTVIQYFEGTNYTIDANGPQDDFGSYPTGLIINFLNAPVTGLSLIIARKTAKTQITEYVDNNPFTAGSLNHALDKLTTMVQDFTVNFRGISQGPPTSVLESHYIGEWYINSYPQANPPASQYFGWTCVQGGAPGTWKGFGLIQT